MPRVSGVGSGAVGHVVLVSSELGGEIRIVVKVTTMKEIKRCMEKDVNGVTKVAKLTGIKMTTLE
ncbi:hypothetical protein TRIUR3_07260 [Triticum urartu]|uniref:Uncharacterized protein n=1 Tax=Triticum urartu TaxID=4572 RepID=M7ZDI2_TRIUA|nr:hypothetical protein TRIUR3_07260 [Triticum urartu]